jgi:ABC-2 type transport system ATP-binding protein
LEQVGVAYAADRPVRRLSKGMLQRTGLAAALVADPELLILDEPMSGLDPIGRKEVRDLMLELRDRGTTVFFSTHILSDVEAITDRVAIVARGQLQAHGTPSELVAKATLAVELSVRLPAAADVAPLVAGADKVRRVGDELSLVLPGTADVDKWIDEAHALGAKILAVTPRHETLEDLFLREVREAS